MLFSCELLYFRKEGLMLKKRIRGENHDAPGCDCIKSMKKIGAGDENRTRMASLEGWSTTIMPHPRNRGYLTLFGNICPEWRFLTRINAD